MLMILEFCKRKKNSLNVNEINCRRAINDRQSYSCLLWSYIFLNGVLILPGFQNDSSNKVQLGMCCQEKLWFAVELTSWPKHIVQWGILWKSWLESYQNIHYRSPLNCTLETLSRLFRPRWRKITDVFRLSFTDDTAKQGSYREKNFRLN